MRPRPWFPILYLLVTLALVSWLAYQNRHQVHVIKAQGKVIEGQSDMIDAQRSIILRQARIIKKLEEVLDEPDKETEALLAQVQ
jgi:hypothetical protein